MRHALLVISALLFLMPLRALDTIRFHQYISGQKLGGSEIGTTKTPGGELTTHREWLKLSRLGLEISQEIRQTAFRKPDGDLHFTWWVQLSQEPFEGEADWSPKAPRLLKLRSKGAPAKDVEVPEGALLWPGDSDVRLAEATRLRRPVRITSFSFPTQQWTELDLGAPKPSPLPGYAEAMRFEGIDVQGPTRMEVRLWASPDQGELKHTSVFSGLELVSQREDLPEPGATSSTSFFDASLKTIPAHPFLTWLPEVTVRWSGKGQPKLPEDPQQRLLGPGRYSLRQAPQPSQEEAAELPVQGAPKTEDLPFLVATPLVQFQDSAFDGLLRRLRPALGATRWNLAQQVTTFVYDWIDRKDFTVGFASALEVSHSPQGDCTEHGVLAVALLRRLGVPARGVVGWVALEQTLGLHFWVEIKLKERWVPVDPTFDQAPASAFRLKLGTTDLADLGSLGWDSAGQAFAEGNWTPEGPWGEALTSSGDAVTGPNGLRLRYPGGKWQVKKGHLTLNSHIHIKAGNRPYGDQRKAAKALASGTRNGWWHSGEAQLWLQVPERRWLAVGPVTEAEAFRLLDELEAHAP